MAARDQTLLDLEIEVGRSVEGRLEVRVLRSPINRPRAPFRLSFGDGQGEAIARRVGDWVDHWVDEGEAPKGAGFDAERLGGELFEALFPEPLDQTLDLSLGSMDGTRGLRLRLSFDDSPEVTNQVACLPWELLRNRGQGEYVALQKATPLVRYLDSAKPLRSMAVAPPLRVLLVPANPEDAHHLDLESESRAIREAVADDERFSIETLEEPTLDGLWNRLNEAEIHVLHFMGHGGFDGQGGFVLFEEPDGTRRTVTDKVLGTLLQAPSLRLVVLAACKGGRSRKAEGSDLLLGMAARLAQRGLPAVVGMQFVVSDRAAARFSEALYQSLARGELLESAVTEGRLAIYREQPEPLEWAAPVLYLRVPEGRLLEIPEAARSSEAPDETGDRRLAIVSMGKDSWGRPALEESDHVRDLTPYFRPEHDGRYIRNDALWPVVAGEVSRFLPGVVSRNRTNVLEMPAHVSIAYAAGRSLEAMAGYDLTLRQRSIDQIHDWRIDEGEVPGLWQQLEEASLEGPGGETALAITVSQSVETDVREFLSSGGPPVGRLLMADLGEGQRSIASGAHAFELAERLFQWVRDRRREESEGPLHLFLSGPVGFAFFLGRLTRDWGTVQLYEHDRDRKKGTIYFPSILVEARR